MKKLKKMAQNDAYKVKIRFREISDGRYSVYLDYRIMINGKVVRERKSLKKYFYDNPRKLKENKSLFKQVLSEREKYERESNKRAIGIFKDNHANRFLYSWIEDQIDKYEGSSKAIWNKMYRHLKKYHSDVLLKDVTRNFCIGFKDYLLDSVFLNQNSAQTYFIRFKTAIKRAFENDLIERNVVQPISIPKKESKREYLTINELKMINLTSYEEQQQVKSAFLFSCFTGLRFSDIVSLNKSDIINENGNYYIHIRIHKTQDLLKIKLNSTATVLYKRQLEIQKSETLLFSLPHSSTVGEHLHKLIKKAKIDKHITFHCGRHTFATLALTAGVDIFAVSKLLGHKNVKVTQIYAKLIDEKRDEAIDKLPILI